MSSIFPSPDRHPLTHPTHPHPPSPHTHTPHPPSPHTPHPPSMSIHIPPISKLPTKRPRKRLSCERCTRHKVGCDHARPKCYRCSKANASCDYPESIINTYQSPSNFAVAEDTTDSYDLTPQNQDFFDQYPPEHTTASTLLPPDPSLPVSYPSPTPTTPELSPDDNQSTILPSTWKLTISHTGELRINTDICSAKDLVNSVSRLQQRQTTPDAADHLGTENPDNVEQDASDDAHANSDEESDQNLSVMHRAWRARLTNETTTSPRASSLYSRSPSPEGLDLGTHNFTLHPDTQTALTNIYLTHFFPFGLFPKHHVQFFTHPTSTPHPVLHNAMLMWSCHHLATHHSTPFTFPTGVDDLAYTNLSALASLYHTRLMDALRENFDVVDASIVLSLATLFIYVCPTDARRAWLYLSRAVDLAHVLLKESASKVTDDTTTAADDEQGSVIQLNTSLSPSSASYLPTTRETPSTQLLRRLWYFLTILDAATSIFGGYDQSMQPTDHFVYPLPRPLASEDEEERWHLVVLVEMIELNRIVKRYCEPGVEAMWRGEASPKDEDKARPAGFDDWRGDVFHEWIERVEKVGLRFGGEETEDDDVSGANLVAVTPQIQATWILHITYHQFRLMWSHFLVPSMSAHQELERKKKKEATTTHEAPFDGRDPTYSLPPPTSLPTPPAISPNDYHEHADHELHPSTATHNHATCRDAIDQMTRIVRDYIRANDDVSSQDALWCSIARVILNGANVAAWLYRHDLALAREAGEEGDAAAEEALQVCEGAVQRFGAVIGDGHDDGEMDETKEDMVARPMVMFWPTYLTFGGGLTSR
ncbi:hypothetical protein BC936DRAFT_145424 [Jimgerdemannia flammicorona]|uniref:Zn(2)-C6 fungal-type domain-containing protein n=1 Tax=Jimgerdemannia flammicorona TaxID=994334 RepID=A0A433DA25_9FUNG|nr:hypothetical protein BC936DRAFT_145424 [Jimgerdemannia flammicorona]